jgi:hypothetical protein
MYILGAEGLFITALHEDIQGIVGMSPPTLNVFTRWKVVINYIARFIPGESDSGSQCSKAHSDVLGKKKLCPCQESNYDS